ncbi:hypothetical protein VU08_04620 [Desulfobulbus sp. F5]|nr:hypothetical protein [Desulfobulbus sp. F5]
MNMNAFTALSSSRVLQYAAALTLCVLVSAGSAAAVTPTQTAADQQAAKQCGCDDKKSVEAYMQNVINDAHRRGVSCETEKMYLPACITVYCSICPDVASRGRCAKMATDYLTTSGFCPPAAAQPGY